VSEKIAIVTGAGRGIGASVARTLSGQGYRLALMAPSQSAIELATTHGDLGIQGSVTEPADLENLVQTTLAKFGRIDAVVNNAKAPAVGELLELTDKDWYESLDLSLLSVVRLSRLVTPIMQRQRSGSIVNISSYLAVQPDLEYPMSSVYRAALASFTKLYSDRYGPEGIRMNNVLPGFMENWDFAEEIKSRIPLRRFGTLEEIGRVVSFLLSDAAGYITGQNIRLDGGLARSV
jgi:NAD(P)-dependent dehydrogenase (short-subunit alcohol dehydrogenase family)